MLLKTGIWTELYKIEDTFMKPLRVGVNMSRAHYERELQNTMEAKKRKAKGQISDSYFSSLFLSTTWRLYACTGVLRITRFHFSQASCDFVLILTQTTS